MRSWRSIYPTDCWDEARRLKIARRFGSAMISNTDSMLFVYSKEHIRVKVYSGRGAQATVAEVGFDSLERLLKRLSALAELTHKLAKKLWALWLGLGVLGLAGPSGPAQAALPLPPQSNSLHRPT